MPPEPDSSETSSTPEGSKRSLVGGTALAVILAGVAAAGGYALGANSGEDLDAAKRAGQAAGEQRGQVEGEKAGRKAGIKQGRKVAYKPAYKKAYDRAYKKALNGE